MAQKTSKPALVGTGSGDVISLAARDTRISTPALTEAQASYIGTRFGLGATRARLTAELVWGRA